MDKLDVMNASLLAVVQKDPSGVKNMNIIIVVIMVVILILIVATIFRNKK